VSDAAEPGLHAQKCAILEVLPNNALATCHQRASLVIRFRCVKHGGGAVIDGAYNIRLIDQSSYNNHRSDKKSDFDEFLPKCSNEVERKSQLFIR